MSTETVKGEVSSSLDTSHLKVPFPFKKKMEIILVENLLNQNLVNILIM